MRKMLILMRSFIWSVTFFWFFNVPCNAGPWRITSVALERPAVDYVNKSLANIYNLTSGRVSRSDPLHYLQVTIEIYVEMDCKDLLVDARVDEFLSNTYRPTFVRTRFQFCDFLRQGIFNAYYARNSSGPFSLYTVDKTANNLKFSIGVYKCYNISWTLQMVPENFPFEKGRVHLNFEYRHILAAAVHTDLELKMVPRKQASKS